MTLSKILALGTTGLMGVALAAAMPPDPADDPPPPHKEKKDGPERKKERPGPGGELKKSYDLLRRLRADGKPAGRPEERLKDWTERATKLYREAVKASEEGEERKSRELGIAAHDLARAVEHARNASTFEPDDDLPPPPEPGGRDREEDRVRRDLRRAHERIVELEDGDEPEAKFFFDASKDLYNAARKDAEEGRMVRAGELARAAEALTHVPEHLARAVEDRPEPKEKRGKGAPKEKRDRPEAKKKHDRPDEKGDRPDKELPPPID